MEKFLILTKENGLRLILKDSDVSFEKFIDFITVAQAHTDTYVPSASQFFTNLSKGAEGSGVMASGQRFLGDTLAKGSDIMSAGLKEGLFRWQLGAQYISFRSNRWYDYFELSGGQGPSIEIIRSFT